MKWILDDKDLVILQLQTQCEAARDIESELRIVKKYDEADRIWASNQKLEVEIDILLGRKMDDWENSASDVKNYLKKAKEEFDMAVKNIKSKVEVAQNIVAAVGMIDKAASIATSLLPLL